MAVFRSTKAALDVMVFPFITNLSILLFVIFSIDLYIDYTEPTIIIAVVTIIWWYIAGFIQFFAYGRVTGEWDALLGKSEKACLVLTIVLTYPIFYLFWLPYVLYHMVMNIGSPWEMWQRMFDGKALSLDKIIPDLVENKCQLALNYLYIGLPWIIFTIIYIGIVIFLAPFWYFIFSPIGYGVFGIVLNVSLRFPSTSGEEIEERLDNSYRLGTLVHVYAVCLPMLILSIVHLAVVGAKWFNVLLLCAAGVNFIVDCFTAVRDYFCSNDLF